MDDHSSSFNWGLRSLELDTTALANGWVSVRSCQIRFKDGTEVSIQNDSIVDPVDVRSLLAGRNWVIVYLTTSGLLPSQTNFKRMGADIGSAGRKEDLEGEREKSSSASEADSVKAQRPKARLLISHSEPTGFEISPLCYIWQLSPEGPPEINVQMMPPLLVIGAWPPLLQELRSLVDAIRDAVDRLYRLLADGDLALEGALLDDIIRLSRQLADGDLALEGAYLEKVNMLLEWEKTKELLGPRLDEPQHQAERLRKLSALNGVSSCLEAITYPGRQPPVAIYTELCRLAGHLSDFHAGRLPLHAPPAYNHEYPGPCFQALIAIIKYAVSARKGTAFLSTEEIATFVYPERRRDPGEPRCIPDPSSDLTIDMLASKILDSLMELFPQAEQLFLCLDDPMSNRLLRTAFKYRTEKNMRVATATPDGETQWKLSKSLVNEVLGQKKAILSTEVDADMNFPTSASITDLKIRSVMCAPLLIPDQQALGIIQVDTTDRKQFSREDLDLLAKLACDAAIAIQNSHLYMKQAIARARCCLQFLNPETSEEKANPAPNVASSESIRRHTDISFPARVHVAKSYNLRVQIILAEKTLPTGEVKKLAKPHDHDVTMSLLVSQPTEPGKPPPDIRVTIDVAAENFEIEGPARAEIIVPLLEKSPAAVFRLRGRKVGPGRVMIDFAQSGRPVGSVDLAPDVVAVDLEDSPDRAATGAELNLGSGPGLDAPDLVIKVFQHRHSGLAGRLHFVISSTDPRLKDLPVLDGDLGTQDLNTDVADWVENQLHALGSLASQPGISIEDVSATLARVGCNLFDQVLPKTLQDMCWTFRQRGIRKVLILSDEPHIPWELIKPYRTDPIAGELIAEDVFWGEAFALTRWLRKTASPAVLIQPHFCHGSGRGSCAAERTGTDP